MSLSAVAICNMALSNIGTRSNIESFSEASAEAAQCSLWYDYARKQTLEAFDWNFARKRIVMALDSDDAPLEEWGFRYQYPADCLRARRIVNPYGVIASSVFDNLSVGNLSDAPPFDVELSSDGMRKTIVTDVEQAKLVYTFDQAVEDFFEPLFVKCLAHLIGSYIAYSLTAKEDVMTTQYKLYEETLGFASMVNANEQVSRAPREAEWIRGR